MPVIYALLAISSIIIIHELGHFMAAKWVGVPVPRFGLGFASLPILPKSVTKFFRLVAYKPGEYIEFIGGLWKISLSGSDTSAVDKNDDQGEVVNTEYVLGAIFFGGYVQMEGEEAVEGEEPCPDGLQNKSIGARAIVFVAGVTMNLITGFIFFIIAFASGVDFVTPQVGQTEPGKPAWKAGLQTGDRIIKLDGDRVENFTDVMLPIALGGEGSPVNLTIKRSAREAGKPPKEIVFSIPRERDRTRGMSTIGLSPPYSSQLAIDPPEGSVAQLAGLKNGDRIIGATLRGVELPTNLARGTLVNAIRNFTTVFPLEPLELVIKRQEVGQPEKEFPVRLETVESPKSPIIGVLLGENGGSFVRNIAGGSIAASTFEIHDQLLSIDGKPVYSVRWELLAEHFKKKSLTLKIRRQSKEIEKTIGSAALLEILLNSEIQWASRDLEVGKIEDGSPLHKAGLRKGDLVLKADTKTVYRESDVTDFLDENTQETGELIVNRNGREMGISISTAALQKRSGLTWRTFPTIRIVTLGGSAQKAGITAGSKIIRLDGKEIFSFDELESILHNHSAKGTTGEANQTKPLKITWRKPDGSSQDGSITPGSPTGDKGLRFSRSRFVVKGGIFEAPSLGVKHCVNTVRQIYLTLSSLVKADVAPKNLAGPVGIVNLFSAMAAWSLIQLLFWMGMVSINLAVLNLLPIPILDGGHLFYLLIEKVTGSPVNRKIQEALMLIFFALFILLALYVTFHDIDRIFYPN